MNIGIDLDGVLVDLVEFQLTIGTPYFKKKYGYEVIDQNAYDVKDIFGCTEKERQKFGWERSLWHYMIRYPAIENAAQIVNQLKKEGHKIYIITGRVFVTEQTFRGRLSRFVVRNWLKRRRISYHDIFFCDEHNSVRDKLLGCEKYGIDIMVEDKPENIFALSENKMKVICFDSGYNRDCVGENIIRARNWNEVYKLVQS